MISNYSSFPCSPSLGLQIPSEKVLNLLKTPQNYLLSVGTWSPRASQTSTFKRGNSTTSSSSSSAPGARLVRQGRRHGAPMRSERSRRRVRKPLVASVGCLKGAGNPVDFPRKVGMLVGFKGSLKLFAWELWPLFQWFWWFGSSLFSFLAVFSPKQQPPHSFGFLWKDKGLHMSLFCSKLGAFLSRNPWDFSVSPRSDPFNGWLVAQVELWSRCLFGCFVFQYEGVWAWVHGFC